MKKGMDEVTCKFIEVVFLIDPTATYSQESGLGSSLPENLLSSLLNATTESCHYMIDLVEQASNEVTEH